MLVPIGEMREPIALLTPTVVIDESGGESTTYTEGDPIFAAVRPVSAKEQVQFGQINAEVTHVCFGHWHDLNAVTADNRLRNLETLDEYDITGPPLNDSKRRHTRLNLIRRENG